MATNDEQPQEVTTKVLPKTSDSAVKVTLPADDLAVCTGFETEKLEMPGGDLSTGADDDSTHENADFEDCFSLGMSDKEALGLSLL